MTSTSHLLTNRVEMWSRIEQAIDASHLSVVVNEGVDEDRAIETLAQLGLPAGNALGAVILNTGGIS